MLWGAEGVYPSKEEVARAEQMTFAQVEPSLPPAGVAGSLPLVHYCSPHVRAQLLDPGSVRLPEAQVERDWPKPHIRASDSEWAAIGDCLLARNICVIKKRRELWHW